MTDIDQALTPVLPRELTSISDAVREVGAPPTPFLAEPYDIRLVDADADAEMVSEWMNRPHLVEAWEYDWPPARWHRYLSAQLDGQYSRPFIGGFRGAPFGYIEVYRAAKDSIAPRYDADPHDIGLHAAIADPKFVNRGLAPICCPAWWPVSSRSNPVVGASCSTLTIATPVPAGSANTPAARSSVSTI